MQFEVSRGFLFESVKLLRNWFSFESSSQMLKCLEGSWKTLLTSLPLFAHLKCSIFSWLQVEIVKKMKWSEFHGLIAGVWADEVTRWLSRGMLQQQKHLVSRSFAEPRCICWFCLVFWRHLHWDIGWRCRHLLD